MSLSSFKRLLKHNTQRHIETAIPLVMKMLSSQRRLKVDLNSKDSSLFVNPSETEKSFVDFRKQLLM